MTEIHIERKGGKGWLWALLAVVVLGLLAWWLVTRRDDGRVTAAAPAEVREYLRWADDASARQDAGRLHEYTAEGIRALAAALGALVTGDQVNGAALQPQLDELRRHAEAIQQNPGSTEHADHARQAMASAAELMGGIQERRFPNLQAQVAEVRAAAQSVRPGRGLLEQKVEVDRFFDRASVALRAMAGAA